MFGYNLLDGGGAATPTWTTYVILGVLALAIIGLFVWSTISNKKKQKEAQSMIERLKPGDKIKTIGGVCGYLVSIDDAENTFILETGDDTHKCYMKFDKAAIYQTGSSAAPETAPAPAEEKKEEVKEEVAEVKEEVKEEPIAETPETPAEKPAKKSTKKSSK